MIAVATQASLAEVRKYMAEPENDLRSYFTERLQQHINDVRRRGDNLYVDNRIEFARRLGWYAIARALKPRVIVETGIDHGVGSVLLCAALKRNAEEGFPGRYYGTDINPKAGSLFADPWNRFGQIIYGDSIESLERFDETIDLFINDSDHSADYEYREYQLIKGKLSDHAIIIGDNAHATDRLRRFSEEEGRKFLFFREVPVDHWYPGAGIGISFK